MGEEEAVVDGMKGEKIRDKSATDLWRMTIMAQVKGKWRRMLMLSVQQSIRSQLLVITKSVICCCCLDLSYNKSSQTHVILTLKWNASNKKNNLLVFVLSLWTLFWPILKSSTCFALFLVSPFTKHHITQTPEFILTCWGRVRSWELVKERLLWESYAK